MATTLWYCSKRSAGGQADDVLAIAQRHGKSAAQVALRWVVQRDVPFVTAGTNETYMREDLHVFDFALDGYEMSLLSAM